MLVISVSSPTQSKTKSDTIRIGTRESQLAQLQTSIVVAAIKANYPDAKIDVIFVTTRGDRTQDRPISALGTRGVFVKELEEALMADEVDLVVHSLKDLPTDLPDGLCLASVLQRADARDVLVSKNKTRFVDLPAGSRIATSSRRRAAQLRSIRQDLEFIDIRGNVPTRLRKHDEGQCEAMVLAAAGLHRLNLQDRITEYFESNVSTPAAGQGALAIECRSNDTRVLEIAASIEDKTVRAEITSERAFLDKLGGGCSVPIGALATADDAGQVKLIGCVASIDGKTVIRAELEGASTNAEKIGVDLADKLLALGARDVLEQLKQIPVTLSPP